MGRTSRFHQPTKFGHRLVLRSAAATRGHSLTHLLEDPRQVHVMRSQNDMLSSSQSVPRFVLISYHLAVRFAHHLTARRWGGLICDESHIMHTPTCDIFSSSEDGAKTSDDAQRNRVCLELARATPRVLLLSGTPSLAKPYHLHHQLMCINPQLVNSRRLHFALDYCVLVTTPHLHVAECHRASELHLLLTRCCMIRRRKADVLPELPRKLRHVVRVTAHSKTDGSATTVKENDERNECNNDAGATTVCSDNTAAATTTTTTTTAAKAQSFQTQYRLHGEAKVEGVWSLLHDTLIIAKQIERIVVFCHHVKVRSNAHSNSFTHSLKLTLKVLDAYELRLRQCASSPSSSVIINYVRIDGAVSVVDRAHRLARFNSDVGEDDDERAKARIERIAARADSPTTAATATHASSSFPPPVSSSSQQQQYRQRRCIVALVGITAGGVGVSFASAACCVFADYTQTHTYT